MIRDMRDAWERALTAGYAVRFKENAHAVTMTVYDHVDDLVEITGGVDGDLPRRMAVRLEAAIRRSGVRLPSADSMRTPFEMDDFEAFLDGNAPVSLAL